MLRERGNFAEAERWRTGPLADLVAVLRTTADTDEAIAARLDSIFAAETERVADAAVLAELLTSLTSATAGAPSRADSGLADSSASTSAGSKSPIPTPPRRPSTDIADFIDEMIAQERAS